MNKKYFMLHLFFSILLFVACSTNEPTIDNSDNGGGDVILMNEGHVLCDGKGVAQVVVTDGKNMVQTNNDGKFSLPYNPSATHVYISSPSGYTVPVVSSVPMFWVNLKKVENRQDITFTLNKMSVSDNSHYFIAVGDPQVRNKTELNKLKPILTEMTAQIASKQMNPVHLMLAGDVVFDTPNMHDDSKTYFSAVGQPVYYTIGNHDHIKTTTISPLNDETSDSTFIRHYGPTYFSFNRGRVHYVVLDNIFYEGGASPQYSTKFTQKQLDWLRKDLSYVSKDKALVVMFHAPSMSRFQASYGNSADLHNMLKGYANVQLLSGHTHYNSVYDNGAGIIEHIVGAASGGFWEGPVCLDGARLGYKIFEVNGTDIKWEYHDYTDPNAQFTVHKPDVNRSPIAPPSNELLVNVWDWDSSWKVTYSDDNGNTFKQMIRYDDKNRVYDPIALKFFGIKGANTVPGRSWIGANTTDHIFTVVPATGVSKIIVQVESRFKTYTQEVDL